MDCSMTSNHKLILATLLLPITLWALPQEEIRAVEAAKQWLVLVDGGKFADAWAAAAPRFQETINKDEWTASLKTLHDELGALEKRSLAKAFLTDKLPESPPGNYAVIAYDSQFLGRDTPAREIVVLLIEDKDESATWRVAGYYLQ